MRIYVDLSSKKITSANQIVLGRSHDYDILIFVSFEVKKDVTASCIMLATSQHRLIFLM